MAINGCLTHLSEVFLSFVRDVSCLLNRFQDIFILGVWIHTHKKRLNNDKTNKYVKQQLHKKGWLVHSFIVRSFLHDTLPLHRTVRWAVRSRGIHHPENELYNTVFAFENYLDVQIYTLRCRQSQLIILIFLLVVVCTTTPGQSSNSYSFQRDSRFWAPSPHSEQKFLKHFTIKFSHGLIHTFCINFGHRGQPYWILDLLSFWTIKNLRASTDYTFSCRQLFLIDNKKSSTTKTCSVWDKLSTTKHKISSYRQLNSFPFQKGKLLSCP